MGIENKIPSDGALRFLNSAEDKRASRIRRLRLEVSEGRYFCDFDQVAKKMLLSLCANSDSK